MTCGNGLKKTKYGISCKVHVKHLFLFKNCYKVRRGEYLEWGDDTIFHSSESCHKDRLINTIYKYPQYGIFDMQYIDNIIILNLPRNTPIFSRKVAKIDVFLGKYGVFISAKAVQVLY
jgi:hypothetical protein